MKNTASSIERLEARIAPASLNAAGNILTYTDIDGDLVKITFTHATLAPDNFQFSTGSVSVGGDTTSPQALIQLNLVNKPGAGFTLKATPQRIWGVLEGDSHANIFAINAANTDLGSIVVDGDVALFDAGTGADGTVGVKSFTALSFGQALDDIASGTLKNVGSFTVKTDFSNIRLTFSGGAKAISIGGDLVERTPFSTAILAIGDVGSLKIGGSVIARSGDQPNIQLSGGNVGSLRIGGSVLGGDVNLDSGNSQISPGNVKTFSIGGDLCGGLGKGGGSVTLSTVGTVKIGGSIVGADNVSSTGFLQVLAGAKSISIGGSVIGGDATTGNVTSNGLLFVVGSVGTLTLGHDFIGGTAAGGTLGSFTSIISVVGSVGTFTVGGSITGDSSHRASISVGGSFTPTLTASAAIQTLKIKGSVTQASLLAGYSLGTNEVNLGAGFGSIAIGGSLTASFITAGSTKGADNIAGTSDDFAANQIATIGSVKIGGAFRGLVGSSTTYFIYAPIINKLTVGKASFTHDELAIGLSFDGIGEASARSQF